MSCDPTSEDFNPLLALYPADPSTSNPDVKVYDNVAVFEANMKRKEKVGNKDEVIFAYAGKL